MHPFRSPLLEGGGPPQRARDPKSPGGRGPSGPGQGVTSPTPFQRLPTGSFARPQGAQNQMPLPVLLSLLFSGICRGYVAAWKNAGEPQADSGHGPVRPILFIGSRASPWSLFRPFLASQKWAAPHWRRYRARIGRSPFFPKVIFPAGLERRGTGLTGAETNNFRAGSACPNRQNGP